MSFWKRIKEEIKRQNTTQEWVASQIPVRQDTFSRWIQRNTIPNAIQTVSIAKTLNVTVEYLVTGEKAIKDPLSIKIESNSTVKHLTEICLQLPAYRVKDLIDIAKAWDIAEPIERETAG